MRPCRARAERLQESFPRKAPKREGVLRRGAAFVALRADDAVLLRTREPKGLLGGMAEPPTSAWSADYDLGTAMLDAPLDARWRQLPGAVRHVFTHFPLELTVFLGRIAAGTEAPEGMRWTKRSDLAGEPLPGAMKKVLAHALDGARGAPRSPPAGTPKGRRPAKAGNG
jgi:A/G-specific adenine glycosylase